MLYRIIGRIFRRHLYLHLVIPLVIGILVEIAYTRQFDHDEYSKLWSHLTGGPRIALYLGIVAAYLVVIAILTRDETTIGARQVDLYALARRLNNASSLFAVGTMTFQEWFDPAVQVYLATLYERKLAETQFRYERILLLARRSDRKNLEADYLDGYHAKCLIGLHRRLGIQLYFLEWQQIVAILNQLTKEEKLHLGFYPSYLASAPDWIIKLFIWCRGRRRVRNAAVGIIEAQGGTKQVFRFDKPRPGKIVKVQFEPQTHECACLKFVELIKNTIYETGTNNVRPEYDFAHYY